MKVYADASALAGLFWRTDETVPLAAAAGTLAGPLLTSELATAQLEYLLCGRLRSSASRVRAAHGLFQQDVEQGRLVVNGMNHLGDAWQFVREWNRGRLSLAVSPLHLVHPALALLNHADTFLSAHPAARNQANELRLRVLPARLSQ